MIPSRTKPVDTLRQAFTTLLYSGEQTDGNGLQYLRARYYDPSIGRFNRLDPFAGVDSDPQSLHKYAYVHGDPISGMDPSGEYVRLYAVLISGALGGFITGISAAIASPDNRAWGFVDGFARGMISGVITSALIVYSNGRVPPSVAAATGAAASTFVVEVSQGLASEGGVDWQQVGKNALIDAAVAYATGIFVGRLGSNESIEEAFVNYAEAIRRAENLRIPPTGNLTRSPAAWAEAIEKHAAYLKDAKDYLNDALIAATLFGAGEAIISEAMVNGFALIAGFREWADDNLRE